MTADDATRELRPSGSPADHGTTQHYEIRVQGHLGAHWAAWFDGLSLSREEDGTTAIRGPVADQAALHGVLRTLCDVGLPLISLTPIPDDAPAAPRADGSKGT